MNNRKHIGAGGKYRFGFNSKENDGEIVATGEGTQDYGMRIYNPAIGRFLSVDPIGKDYPWYTSYQYAGNRPIDCIDLDGTEDAKFDIMERNTRKAAKQLYPNDPVKQEQYIHKATSDRAYGALIGAAGLLVTVSAPAIYAVSLRIALWVAANPEMAMQGTALIGGLFYEGPEDLMPGSNADEIGKALKGGGMKVLDFFGGKISKYKEAFNIDIIAERGYKGTIKEFVKFMTDNKLLGTIDKVIVDNPYGYMDYLKDASKVLKEGGTVTIRGTKSNKFFNSVLNGTMEGLEDFKVKTPVKQISKEGMKTTEGNDIKGEVFEIILEKK